MEKHPDKGTSGALPPCAVEYIDRVVAAIRYRRRVRREIAAELTAHFEDALKDETTDAEKERQARAVIEQFGDPKLLAVLCRRAKKRGRPLWQKTLIRSLAALGIVLLYLLACSARLLIGTPRVQTDYVVKLSEDVSQGKEASLNARLYFDKAARLAGEHPGVYTILPNGQSRWPGDMNEPQRRAVAGLLEKSAGAFDVLSQGVTKPYCWADYRPKDANGADKATVLGFPGAVALSYSGVAAGSLVLPDAHNEVIFRSLADYRNLALTLALRARWRAWGGDLEGAWADCLALYSLGWHLQGRGLLAEQLVGVALDGLARETCVTILDRADVPAPLLQQAQEQIEAWSCHQQAVLSLTADRLFWYDYIQRTFTDDGNGRGRPLKAALPLVAADWQDGVVGLATFSYPGRAEMVRRVDEFYDATESFLSQIPWQVGPGKEASDLKDLASDSFLLSLLVDPHVRLTRLVWCVKTGRRASVATLATLRYRKDKGVYPESLDTLFAAGYLSEIPIDPYSGRSFAYRRTPEGFLLYSWGEDLKDDGGQLGTGSNGKPRMWSNNGDWVFWPYSE